MDKPFEIELKHGVIYVDTNGVVTYEGVDPDGYLYTDEGTISEFQCRELLVHIEGY